MNPPVLNRFDSDPAFQKMVERGRRRKFEKGQVILNEGEMADTLFYLQSGSISVRQTDERGDESLLTYRYAGEFFGEMCLLPGVRERSARVQARDDCVAIEIAYDQFLELSRTYTSLWQELAGQLAERLRATNQRLAMMPLRRAVDRIWSVVAEVASHTEANNGVDDIPVRVTRQELGKLAGCSREVAGEVLKDLERSGQLKRRGQTLLVSASALTERTRAWPAVA